MGTPSSGENHRRIDRATVADRGYGTPTAQMTDHETQLRAFEVRSNSLRAPLHGEPVEAEAPNTPLLAPGSGKRVGRSLYRHRRVERRVEDRHVRHRGNARVAASTPARAGLL